MGDMGAFSQEQKIHMLDRVAEFIEAELGELWRVVPPSSNFIAVRIRDVLTEQDAAWVTLEEFAQPLGPARLLVWIADTATPKFDDVDAIADEVNVLADGGFDRRGLRRLLTQFSSDTRWEKWRTVPT